MHFVILSLALLAALTFADEGTKEAEKYGFFSPVAFPYKPPYVGNYPNYGYPSKNPGYPPKSGLKHPKPVDQKPLVPPPKPYLCGSEGLPFDITIILERCHDSIYGSDEYMIQLANIMQFVAYVEFLFGIGQGPTKSRVAMTTYSTGLNVVDDAYSDTSVTTDIRNEFNFDTFDNAQDLIIAIITLPFAPLDDAGTPVHKSAISAAMEYSTLSNVSRPRSEAHCFVYWMSIRSNEDEEEEPISSAFKLKQEGCTVVSISWDYEYNLNILQQFNKQLAATAGMNFLVNFQKDTDEIQKNLMILVWPLQFYCTNFRLDRQILGFPYTFVADVDTVPDSRWWKQDSILAKYGYI